MITIIIAILISWGIITSEADYNNLNEEEKVHYEEIIIHDELNDV